LLLLSCLVELRDLPLECLGNGVLLPGVAAEPNERVINPLFGAGRLQRRRLDRRS
jgi:hypothetical protein